VIWSKEVAGLGNIYVEDALLPKAGYRATRQYLVKMDDRKGVKGVCKVDASGHILQWYTWSSMITQKEWMEIMDDLPATLLIEQVMET
jgi:hypothetical protein